MLLPRWAGGSGRGNVYKKTPCNSILDFDFGYECPPPSFINAHIRREVANISDDILEPYTFGESVGLQNVFPYEHRSIQASTLTIKDILTDAFFGADKVISKLSLKNEFSGSDYIFLVNTTPNEDNTIDFGDYKNLVPEKMLVFQPFFKKDEVDLIRMNICMLWECYQKLKRSDYLDRKSIYYMKGFHALLKEIATDQAKTVMEETVEKIRADVRKVVESECGIMDADDKLGSQGSSDGLNLAKATTARIDLIYSEIARLYRIPIPRLLGRSPTGFNTTGEYDEKNYDDTLKKYRHNWLDPLLKQMGIVHKKNESANIEDIEKLGKLIIDLDITDEEGEIKDGGESSTLRDKVIKKVDSMLDVL